MTPEQAKEILGKNRARYELRNIIRALSRMNLLNTIEENERLEAAKVLLNA